MYVDTHIHICIIYMGFLKVKNKYNALKLRGHFDMYMWICSQKFFFFNFLRKTLKIIANPYCRSQTDAAFSVHSGSRTFYVKTNEL